MIKVNTLIADDNPESILQKELNISIVEKTSNCEKLYKILKYIERIY